MSSPDLKPNMAVQFKKSALGAVSELLEEISTLDGTERSPEEMFRSRIFRILPPDMPFIHDLLSFSLVGFSEATPTAAISQGCPPMLVFNPDFYERHCRRDEWLLVVLLHELHHIRYAHHLLFGVADALKNLAFDAIVNAQIARILRRPEYLSFFRHFYPDPGFPAVFLAPPPLWEYAEHTWENAPETARLRERVFGPLGPEAGERGWRLYRRLYDEWSREPVLFSELVDFFQSLPGNGGMAMPSLLGSHGSPDALRDAGAPPHPPSEADADDSEEEETESLASGPAHPDDAWMAEQRRRLAEDPFLDDVTRQMESCLDRRRKATGVGYDPNLRSVAVPLASPKLKAMRTLKQLCVRLGIYNQFSPERALRPVASETLSTEPQFSAADRTYWARSILWDCPPVLCQHARPIQKKTWDAVPACHVYLDVSGSMKDDLPWLLSAFIRLAAMGLVRAFMFSNRVVPVSLSALRKGQVHTTGGTDLDCVLRHVLDTPRFRRPRQILVVTDGDFYRPGNLGAFTKTGVKLHLALIQDTWWNTRHTDYANSVTILKEL